MFGIYAKFSSCIRDADRAVTEASDATKMGRKRKAKKRSSAPKRRRRISSSSLRCSNPSFVVDFNIEQENYEDDDDEEDEDEEEEEEISILACDVRGNEPIGTRARSSLKSHPPPACRGDSDDDSNIELQRALENDLLESDKNGVPSSSFKRNLRRVENDKNCVPSSSFEGNVQRVESVSENERFQSTSLQPEATCHEAGTDTKPSEVAENYVAEDEKKKGKEKVFEVDEIMKPDVAQEADETGQLCGVCLTEKTQIDRGKLDCCDHFFCFGCIMEWAKVESRCPICKQRFVSIVKHGSPGKRTRTVRIPTRNQIYVPSDEIVIEDPYADVVCMECQGTDDEGLLLLCDRCDAAAHTFCVGLGMSVPRGDWFCRVCEASRTDEETYDENEEEELILTSESENLDSEEDEDSILRAIVASPESSRHQQRKPVARTPSNIIFRSRLSNAAPRKRVRSSIRRRILRRPSHRCRDKASVQSLPSAVRALGQASERSISSQNTHTADAQLPNASARTVPQQRRLQERIHFMRSNWDRIQNGNLQFDAICSQSSDSSSMIHGSKNPIQSVQKGKSILEPRESLSKKEKELEQAWQMMSSAQRLLAKTNQQASVSSNVQINRLMIKSPPNSLRDVETACLNEGHSKHLSKGSIVDGSSSAVTRLRSFNKCYDEDKDDKSVENSVNHENSRENENKLLPKQTIKPPAMIEKCEKVNEMRNLHINHSSRSSTETQGSHVGSKNWAGASSELKVHLTELVKKQIWPSYLAEKLGKEQFKQIARCAVHTLLEFCDSESAILSCSHLDERCRSPLEMCCKKCLSLHVEKAVKTAKDKIVPVRSR